MTTIGKILVVLHLALSIMFMAFAGAVFTAQTNWKAAEKLAQADKAKAETKVKEKQAEIEKLLTEQKQAKDELENALQRLKGDNKRLEDEAKTLIADNKQLRKEVDQQRDQAALTTTEAAERKKEADLQREKNGELYVSREEIEAKLSEALDRIFAQDLQLQQYEEKHEQALNDIRTYKAYLASKDLTTDPKQMVALITPPPPLQGRVLEVLRPNRRSKQEYVEVSIGSDSGLVVNNKLTVYRGEKYLGDLVLTRVEADKSVGIVKVRAPNAEFQVGDEVTTKF
jgi:chromosome segregation ATPase